MPLLVILGLLLLSSVASAQQGNGGPTPANGIGGRKSAQAVRVPSNSIAVDGRLNEAAWRDIPPITDFVQKEPVEGALATDPMDVRFAYDDTGLYVGARMGSTGPIQAPMGR